MSINKNKLLLNYQEVFFNVNIDQCITVDVDIEALDDILCKINNTDKYIGAVYIHTVDGTLVSNEHINIGTTDLINANIKRELRWPTHDELNGHIFDGNHRSLLMISGCAQIEITCNFISVGDRTANIILQLSSTAFDNAVTDEHKRYAFEYWRRVLMYFALRDATVVG